jgi:hypothetical protein
MHHLPARQLGPGACPERATATEWACTICSSHVVYSPDQLDFFAALVIPVDTWYILPIRATNNQPVIVLSPHLTKSKCGPYQEAWHLLTK